MEERPAPEPLRARQRRTVLAAELARVLGRPAVAVEAALEEVLRDQAARVSPELRSRLS